VEAGIQKHIHPHLLRHASITAALEAGAPLHVVQDMARHADPRTTQRYNRRRHSIDGHATHLLDGYLAANIAHVGDVPEAS
jgi:integrase/recombinase XerD